MESSDAELIAAVLQGDPASFEPLVQKYSPRLFATARRYARREDEVQDIVESIERSPNTFVRWIGLGPEYKDVYFMPQYGREARMARILELWRAYATGRINSTHG